MIRRNRSLASMVPLVVACALLSPARGAAQTVLARVLTNDTSEPIVGALVHLLDEEGRALRSVLSDPRGRALFVGIPPARYRVRAEMIGMATSETIPFDVGSGATDAGELRLDPRPIGLERIDVTAESRCTARPAGEGLLVATLWEEARKALSATTLTEERGLFRYETVRYERDVDADSRLVVREEEAKRDGFMRVPFESLSPEDFAEGGFVRREGLELAYYAPDARVLLSDAFLDTHCFRVVEGAEGGGVVGLGFEPTGRRRSLVDISGTLWLSEETAELRWLDYVYSNLDLPVAAPSAGGRVAFERMSGGTWIIPDWWIDMPVIGTRFIETGSSRPFLRNLRRTGGRVVTVHEGGGRVLAGRGDTGGIEGLVVDSAGAAMAGVRVGVIGGSQEVFSDAEGRFGLLGLREGTYEVRFIDSRVSTAGLVPPPVVREVIRREVSYLEFYMPSVAEMMTEACRAESPPAGTGMLAGRVLSDTALPMPQVTVRVTWADVRVTGSFSGGRTFVDGRAGFEAETGPNGVYRVCGLPRGEALAVTTIADGREVDSNPVTIGADDAGRVHDIRRPGIGAR